MTGQPDMGQLNMGKIELNYINVDSAQSELIVCITNIFLFHKISMNKVGLNYRFI